MNDKKKKETNQEQELLNSISNIFDEIAPETSEEVDEHLRELGYDPDALAKKARDSFKDALRNSPLNWRNQGAQIEKAQTRLDELKSSVKRSRDEIIEVLRQRTRRGQPVIAHFRNLEEVTTEDLANLLAELEFSDKESSDGKGE